MSDYSVYINLKFNAPVEKIYSLLSDHPTLGRITGVKMKRIIDSKNTGDVNGAGSVRRFSIGLPMEETVTKSEKNKLVEYTITKGMHFFNSHYGTMIFKAINENECALDYTITIGIKFPILSKLILNAVGAAMRKSLISLNKKLKENPNYQP